MFLSFSELLASLSYNVGEVNMYNVINGFKPMVLVLYIYAVFINFAEEYKSKINLDTKDEKQENIQRDKNDDKAEIPKTIDIIKTLGLTRREKEIFDLLLKDMPNKEISENLYISEATVKKHIQNILKKAECGNRNELIKKYVGE